jgi:palmitoyl-protein thioesterase
MMRLVSSLKSALPGVFVHSIRIGDSPEEDRKKSLLDGMNRQITEVCRQLASIPELADGFNAIGISQGGQFIRAYVERCNAPKVKLLITLGSQHQGVMALPGCTENNTDQSALSIEEAENAARPRTFLESFSLSTDTSNIPWFPRTFAGRLWRTLVGDGENSDCAWWKRLLKLGVYSPLVRSHVVQAQYFKDPANLMDYYDHNQFLLDINNDHPDPTKHNKTYAENMAQLHGFYMYIFEEDTVVVPKESGWFALHDAKEQKIKFLTELPIYRLDRLGLRQLDKQGKLFFRKLPGQHLKLSNSFLTGELADILK